ncbi:MAG TPA: DUF4126 family protein [Candidatus Acidoferrales bacterium]|jgi:uncharacterized membrane protein|nr:DUF4126 family protein [Candidatus Acidoferrales bacterium]
MSPAELYLLLFAIGFVAGLRTVTPPAAVAWAAHLGWINLSGTRLSFLSSILAVASFTIGAAAEYVTDQLPSTPARTVPVQLGARIVSGGFCGAALALAVGQPVIVGIILAMVGAVAGTYGGYYARRNLVRSLKVSDFAVAVAEDLIALGAAFFIVSRF